MNKTVISLHHHLLLVILQIDVIAKSLVQRSLQVGHQTLHLFALQLNVFDLLLFVRLAFGQQFLGAGQIVRHKHFADQERYGRVLVEQFDFVGRLLQVFQLVLFAPQFLFEVLEFGIVVGEFVDLLLVLVADVDVGVL
jgi:hypothetical protein